MEELIVKFDLKLMSSIKGVDIYTTPLKGLLVSNHNFYFNSHIPPNHVFIFFRWKNYRFYTTWHLEVALYYSKESFYEWFKFNVKRKYKQSLITNILLSKHS